MKAVILALLLLPHLAWAYLPETLLGKAAGVHQDIESLGTGSSNPFANVKLSYDFREYLDESQGVFGPLTQKGLNTARFRHVVDLSLTPRLFAEARAYHAFEDVLNKATSVTNALSRATKMRTAYLLLIETARLKEIGAQIKNWTELLALSQKISRVEARKSEPDVRKFLKANLDAERAKSELIEIAASRAKIETRLSEMGLTIEGLETEDLLGAGEIDRKLSQAKDAASLGITSSALATRLEADRANLEYARAKHRRLIDEFKVGVGKSTDETIYRVSVTLNLPWLAANDLNEQNDRLRFAEDEAKRRAAILEDASRREEILAELKGKIALYQEIAQSPLFKAEISSDPSLSLELRRMNDEHQRRASLLLAQIRAHYIELLFENGTLSEQADLNALSKSSRRI